MPTDHPDVTSIDALVQETRAIREAVHDLVARLRQDRLLWASELESLSRRARLMAAQRERFRAHLDAHAHRE